jgi:hypothetical protein
MGFMTGESEFDSRWGQRFFSSPSCPQQHWDPSILPPIQVGHCSLSRVYSTYMIFHKLDSLPGVKEGKGAVFNWASYKELVSTVQRRLGIALSGSFIHNSITILIINSNFLRIWSEPIFSIGQYLIRRYLMIQEATYFHFSVKLPPGTEKVLFSSCTLTI